MVFTGTLGACTKTWLVILVKVIKHYVKDKRFSSRSRMYKLEFHVKKSALCIKHKPQLFTDKKFRKHSAFK